MVLFLIAAVLWGLFWIFLNVEPVFCVLLGPAALFFTIGGFLALGIETMATG